MAKYFALSPGGMGFYGHVGALKMLHDNHRLSAMEEISGGSAGAIAAYLHIICKNDFELLMNEAMEADISEITNLNLRNFFTKYGFINTDGFKSKFIETTRQGDEMVETRTDYIKRVIGMPGDTVAVARLHSQIGRGDHVACADRARGHDDVGQRGAGETTQDQRCPHQRTCVVAAII
jgi:predicted acylesterase/phospholipase RssA